MNYNTKSFGEGKKRRALSLIKDALESARMERASFENFCEAGRDLPTNEKQVTEFIKERTRLYRESWIIGRLEQLKALIEGDAA